MRPSVADMRRCVASMAACVPANRERAASYAATRPLSWAWALASRAFADDRSEDVSAREVTGRTAKPREATTAMRVRAPRAANHAPWVLPGAFSLPRQSLDKDAGRTLTAKLARVNRTRGPNERNGPVRPR